MKNRKVYLVCILALISLTKAEKKQVNLTDEGYIKHWLISAPYELDMTGFGNPGDKSLIDETKDVNYSKSNSEIKWTLKTINSNDFLDLNEIYSKLVNDEPSKIWHAKAAYAYAEIFSDSEKQVKLSFGGNTISKVVVNGKEVYKSLKMTNAAKDDIKKSIMLKKGSNNILVKVINNHKNYSTAFFIPIKHQWGFYFKVKENDDLHQIIDLNRIKPKLKLTPSIFIKDINGKNKQKYYGELISDIKSDNAEFTISYKGNKEKFDLENIKFGHNYFELYLPEVTKETNAKVNVKLENNRIEEAIKLNPVKHYELHLMMLTHTDIGYTHTQPIVKERHLKALDEAVAMSEKDDQFKWTLETLWQLELYELYRTTEEFEKLMKLIKSGRFYVSPIYTNPFTGYVSKNEMMKSVSIAEKYKKKYGLEFNAAVYNDVPGESWYLPKVLNEAGINFLANGINEIYGDYLYQLNLPKAFIWQGADSSMVINYLNESYVEGMYYGLARDNKTIEDRIWQRVKKSEQRGYGFEMFLLNSAFTDNAGVAVDQFKNAKKWNKEYKYPKFVFTTLNDFSKEFSERYADKLPVIKGDFTSAWDILNQGEFERHLQIRKIQRDTKANEILAGINWLSNEKYKFDQETLERLYKNSLMYTGHGSGLELGYGTLEENLITDKYRENYVENALLAADELKERTIYGLTVPIEGLENFGAIVFNTSNSKSGGMVQFGFSFFEQSNYEVFDIKNEEKVESYYNGKELSFYAADIPAYGYKVFRFKRISGKNNKVIIDDSLIENDFYKIKIDRKKGEILSIIDKELGVDLISNNKYNLTDVVKNLFNSQELSKVKDGDRKLTVTRKGDILTEIDIHTNNKLIPTISLSIPHKKKLIELKYKFDLRKLKETDITENYSVLFPFLNDNSEIIYDVLGEAVSEDERMKWVGHDYYSVRDYVAIKRDDANIVVVSPDARIFNKNKIENVLLSNVVNNFPKNWNRNEKNSSVLNFRFKITSVNKKESIENCAEEVAANLYAKRFWFKNIKQGKSYITISDSRISIESIRALGEKSILVRLKNNSDKKVNTEIKSKLFSDKYFFDRDFWNSKRVQLRKEDSNSVKIKFDANQYRYIEISRKQPTN